MEYYNYVLVFPDGDRQEIDHPLEMGDIVDINGNPFKTGAMHIKKIAYRVSGIKQDIHFKEITYFYKLSLLDVAEVEDEIIHRKLNEQKRKEKLDNVFSNLEKKFLKNKR